MPLDAGTAFLKVLPQLGPQFNSALAAQVQPALSRIGSRTSQIGSAMTKWVTLPIIGIGAAAVASAVKVDDALDLIRSRTGAVGKELQTLEADFEAIGRTTPADLMSIAEVVSDLNQRLDLTGPRLRTLAKQILESGRILDQGAVSVDAITRLFGDWNIATRDQTKTLDTLFRASQAGGGTISALAEGVVQFGAPLRSLGFTLEESIALWARFQAEGVNTTTVMAGMRMFLSNAAEEGQNAEEAFRRVTAEILALTEAGKDAEAQDLAREWFGARTFQDVVRAIQEGRFELEDWLKTLRDGKSTILETAKDTQDFGEQWTIFKNKAILALAPLGERLFPALSSAIETVTGAVTTLVEAFTDLPAGVQKGIIFTLLGAAVAGPFLRIAGGIMSIASSLFQFARGAKAAAAAPAIGRILGGGAGAAGAGAGAAAGAGLGAAGAAFLAILPPLIVGVGNFAKGQEDAGNAVDQHTQALLSGRESMAEMEAAMKELQGSAFDLTSNSWFSPAWQLQVAEVQKRVGAVINGQAANLRRLGVELTDAEQSTIDMYLAQGNLYGVLLTLRGALNQALGPLKNLVPSHKQAAAAAADQEQKVKGLTAVYGGIPRQIDVNIDTKLTNYEQALAKLRALERPLTTPWYIKGIVQPPAGGIPGKVGAQHGFAGTVSAPTLFMAGEGGQSEDVLVVPHSKGGIARVAGGNGMGGGSLQLNFGDFFIEDASVDMDMIREMIAGGIAEGFERLHYSGHMGG